MAADEFLVFRDWKKSAWVGQKRLLVFVLPVFVLLCLLPILIVNGFSVPVKAPGGWTVLHVPPTRGTIFSDLPYLFAGEFLLVFLIETLSRFRKKALVAMLNSEGITVYLSKMAFGPIHWDEIEDVRLTGVVRRMIGIVPMNSAAIRGRMERTAGQMLRFNSSVIPLARAVGIFTAPINIAADTLSVSDVELLARIQAYRDAAARARAGWTSNGPAVHDEGVWPPAPVG